ncbi:MAG: MAC/perforin domain-containing protein [Polyangiaceae bacterium]
MRDGYLTPLAADVINSPTVSADTVIDFFGTHVLADAVYGARFEYSSATNTWAYAAKTSAAVAVEVSFQSLTGSGSGSSDFSSTEEREEYNSNSVTRVRAAGGDSELAGGLGDLEAWRASIDDNDPVLVQFSGNQPLIPIWELAQSEARRRELQAAVEDIASRIGAIVNGDSALVITGESSASTPATKAAATWSCSARSTSRSSTRAATSSGSPTCCRSRPPAATSC